MEPACIQSKFFNEKLLSICVSSIFPPSTTEPTVLMQNSPSNPSRRTAVSFRTIKWPPRQVHLSCPVNFSLQIGNSKVKQWQLSQFQEQLFCCSNKVFTYCNCSTSSAGAPLWSSFSFICKITGKE